MLRKGRVAVLCNQVAWHPDTGEYLFETLARRGNLVKIFTPEHALYGPMVEGIETVEVTTTVEEADLEGIDALVDVYRTEMGLDDRTIIDKIASRFDLTGEQAKAYVLPEA